MSNYRRGAEIEREIVNRHREQGHLAARSAGSHSPMDVWAINLRRKPRGLRCREAWVYQVKRRKRGTARSVAMPLRSGWVYLHVMVAQKKDRGAMEISEVVK